MLLGAEWKPDLQCFVKIVSHEPDESDGFVWPAPTFRFFSREGKEIEGRDKARKMKFARATVPIMNTGFRAPGKSNAPKTATEIRQRMEESTKRLDELTSKAAKQMEVEMNSHLLDALMYGQGFAYTKEDLKIQRPVNIWKVHQS